MQFAQHTCSVLGFFVSALNKNMSELQNFYRLLDGQQPDTAPEKIDVEETLNVPDNWLSITNDLLFEEI
jgi:hypothetical protein